jgi:hypothetical protein
LTTLLLRDGDFVACVYRGLVDDYVRQAVKTVALKVLKSARKKFSKLIIHVYEREISAWDYYCYGLAIGHSAFRDKFISDFIRLAIMKRIDDLSEEKRRLMEISACDFLDIDEKTVLRREAVSQLIDSEFRVLALEYGRSLQVLYANAEPAQSIAKGLSPA